MLLPIYSCDINPYIYECYNFWSKNISRIQLAVLNCPEEKSVQTLESEKWLTLKVLPKLSKWSQNIPKHPIVPSIQLVPAKNYSETLHYLKKKYAKKFVEVSKKKYYVLLNKYFHCTLFYLFFISRYGPYITIQIQLNMYMKIFRLLPISL